MAKLLYQGHGSYRLQSADGRVIYVDPYVGDGYELPADFVLITHEHYDHTNLDLVRMKADGIILRAADMIEEGQYLKKTYGDFIVRAVPAYNLKHDRDACVGYVMGIDWVKVYGSGDTSRTDCMEAVLSKENIDYALLCIDVVYNMNPEEASECTAIIRANHSIPIHVAPADSQRLFDLSVAESFHAEGRLILRPGEEIELGHKD
ncbi:MBL fold metallo-hydrolase [Eubacterium aggregans]|uniref:MBL fold metallo-hydrolase n=1 Tax=Eubacterium aggregans TaxID=81409 RepID=UPI003F372EE8